MAGKVFLYNSTSTNLKIKINDDTVTDTGAHFLAATTRETNWQARLGNGIVDRAVPPAANPPVANTVGSGQNKFYIYRDALESTSLDGSEMTPYELLVIIDDSFAQLSKDLALYVFVVPSLKFGYFLLDEDGFYQGARRPSPG